MSRHVRMILSFDLSHSFNSCSYAVITCDFLQRKLENKSMKVAVCVGDREDGIAKWNGIL
jgi:hypothetical protein